MRRLPPLNAIRAFEAAARHASFKRAASELNVTHGAISHQVSLLENWLKLPLFRRLNRQVVLTEEGRALLSDVTPALDRISLAVAALARERHAVIITINAPPTFTMRWLIPRLPGFLQMHPGIEVRLSASIAPVDFSGNNYDIAIRRGAETPAGLHDHVFLKEMLLPVCSPALIARGPLTAPADLSQHVLIHTGTSPTIWPEWLETVHVRGLRTAGSLRFDELFFSLEAAANGLGIAIAPAALVAEDVAAGRLVFPFATPFRQGHDYRILYAPLPEKTAGITTFLNWALQQGAASAALVEELLTGASS